MKVAILDVRKNPTNYKRTRTVAFRNLIALQQAFDADIYSSIAKLKVARNDYDIIICGFGSLTTEIDYSTRFLITNKTARLFWLVGEYEQRTFQPLFYSKRPYSVIKNFEHQMKGTMIVEQHFVNINLLLAKHPLHPQKAINNHKYGIVYYGRWRPDRAQYFKEYLQKGIYISTSVKNMKKFKGYGVGAIYCKPMTWDNNRETLRLFRGSLYLEDVFTHTHYNCPANRFYESLFCGSIVIPQIESRNTWERYGIDMTRRFVSDLAELQSKMIELEDKKTLIDLLEEQYEWGIQAINKREVMLSEVNEIFSNSC
jgi:hypothetical protein